MEFTFAIKVLLSCHSERLDLNRISDYNIEWYIVDVVEE